VRRDGRVEAGRRPPEADAGGPDSPPPVPHADGRWGAGRDGRERDARREHARLDGGKNLRGQAVTAFVHGAGKVPGGSMIG
jgi:hypothetical protein